MRLSMTSAGSARLLREDESSPSPPRAEKLRPLPPITRATQRSLSATDANGLLQSNNRAGVDCLPRGHSRNSKAWEYWCDSEARGELVKKADLEQKGSAADAISLMRSTSRRALSTIVGAQARRKRVKTDHDAKMRPSLGRAQSSVGRLQGREATGSSLRHELKTPGKSNTRTSSIPRSPDGDSDKENEDPDSLVSRNPRRRVGLSAAALSGRQPPLKGTQTAPGVLSEASTKTLPKANAGRLKSPGRGDGQNSGAEEDEEVAIFMGGTNAPKSRSSEPGGDDLSCVQGLLSLSQGNWK